MILKEHLVLEKTKAESLAGVRNLNLWGVGLTDVSIVAKIPGIEVLALASNHLTTLSFFASCMSLRELYLRKNRIASLSEIKYLKALPNLHTLWLMDNPCATHPKYRSFVIVCCSHLKQLDSVEVTEEERDEAKKTFSEKMVQEILEGKTAEAGTPNTKQPQPQPLDCKSLSKEKPVENRHINAPERQPNKDNKGMQVNPGRQESAKEVWTGCRPTPDGSSGRAIRTQRAIFTAIVSLISELSFDSLEALKKEVGDEMHKRRVGVERQSRGMP